MNDVEHYDELEYQCCLHIYKTIILICMILYNFPVAVLLDRLRSDCSQQYMLVLFFTIDRTQAGEIADVY